jgi:hypothetical protein
VRLNPGCAGLAESGLSQQAITSALAAAGPSGPIVYPILRCPRRTSQRVALRRTANQATLGGYQ